MAKKVKKGFRMEYVRGHGKGERRMTLEAHEGEMRVTVQRHGAVVCFDLPAGDVEALWATPVIEDVPEPWERLRGALHSAAAELGRTMAHPVYQLPSDVLVRAAEMLGIEPEGE